MQFITSMTKRRLWQCIRSFSRENSLWTCSPILRWGDRLHWSPLTTFFIFTIAFKPCCVGGGDRLHWSSFIFVCQRLSIWHKLSNWIFQTLCRIEVLYWGYFGLYWEIWSLKVCGPWWKHCYTVEITIVNFIGNVYNLIRNTLYFVYACIMGSMYN